MNKILVTGGAGFIGSHIVDKLVEHGNDVTVVDDFSTGSLENIDLKAKVIELDISKKNAFEILNDAMFDVDYVFNLAAIPRTQYCVENPIECHNANVSGTLNVLSACLEHKDTLKKIIHSSSCGVYGPQEKLPISEDAPINHGTPYSLQKYMQELYMKLYSDLFGLPVVMLRYFNVYGTQRQTEKGSYPNVLAAFSKQKREYGKIFVTSDGEQSRDMIHVFDVAEVNIKAAESDLIHAEIMNVGTGKALTINEMARCFDCPIEYIAARPGEARHLYADTTKVEKLLGWKPKISFEEGIRGYLKDIIK